MFRVGRRHLLFNKNSYLTFKSIYGIGSIASAVICMYLGFRTEHILFGLDDSHYIFLSLRELFSKVELFLEIFLRKKNKIGLYILKRLHAYRGIRYFRGFPIRGQRRHTNARTVRRLVLYR